MGAAMFARRFVIVEDNLQRQEGSHAKQLSKQPA